MASEPAGSPDRQEDVVWTQMEAALEEIEAGDRATGMMVMRMEAGLDTGPVAITEEITIGDTETAGELHDRL